MSKQRPTRRPGQHPTSEVTLEHPAFGLIQASRVSASKGQTLFGAAGQSHSFIQVTIHDAVAHVSGMSERPFPTKVRLQFMMTETQWGSFLSSVNVGVGTPITKEYGPADDAKLVAFPGIERESPASSRANTIRKEVKEHLDELMSAHADLKRILASPGSISKKDLNAILTKLTRSVENAPANFAFLADKITEHMEKTASEAKTEIQAHAAALGLAGNGPLSLEDKSS